MPRPLPETPEPAEVLSVRIKGEAALRFAKLAGQVEEKTGVDNRSAVIRELAGWRQPKLLTRAEIKEFKKAMAASEKSGEKVERKPPTKRPSKAPKPPKGQDVFVANEPPVRKTPGRNANGDEKKVGNGG